MAKKKHSKHRPAGRSSRNAAESRAAGLGGAASAGSAAPPGNMAPRGSASLPPRRMLMALEAAIQHIKQQEYPEADEILTSLERRYPGRRELLLVRMELSERTEDWVRFEAACEGLLQIEPDTVDASLALVAAYLRNERPALALEAGRRFLKRWPDHDEAGKLAQTVAGIEENLQSPDRPGPLPLESLVKEERVQSLVDRGLMDQAFRLAEDLLRTEPQPSPPILNNLSLMYWVRGDVAQATAMTEKVLAQEPDNVHALSNMAHYLCLAGRLEEAREMARRALNSPRAAPSSWTKVAEAMAYVGDDENLIAAYEQACSAHGRLKDIDPLLHHLAGVAHLRMGREKEAKLCWRRALEGDPGLEVASENLEDLKKPVEQRNAPWPFDMPNWLPQYGAILSELTRGGSPDDTAALTRNARRLLQTRPELNAIIPILLDRGDPHGRELAFGVAGLAGTPAMQEALRAFALSPRGPDEMRMKAAQQLSEAGLLDDDPVRMWIEGDWREIHLRGWEIYSEPEEHYSPAVQRLMQEGAESLQAGDGQRAETLLKQARALEPDDPAILNNLAMAYSLQGRKEESDALIQQVQEQYPDYFFGIAAKAMKLIAEDRLEEAEELIRKMQLKRRLHVTEFAALADAQVRLLIGREQYDGAESWLDMWEDVDPDNPRLEQHRERLELLQGLERIKTRLMPRVGGGRSRKRR